MKRIFSIIMDRALAYPRALLPSGGPLALRILTVDHTFKLIFSSL